nr:hypothetical protein [Tanacetum cinerariifolium]
MVAKDDEMSNEKDIDKLTALTSVSFKKIYKPTNNNLRTSSNTNRSNHDNSPRINKGTGYDNHKSVNVVGVREIVGTQVELEAHYLYMAKIQEVTLDAADNSRLVFNPEPLQKVQYDEDSYNVFANDKKHPKQPKSINDTYLGEQGDTNITTDSLYMSTNGEEAHYDDDDDNLARKRDLFASLIEKLKCEIDESKNHNKLLESSNKTLFDKLKSEIEDFKTKNKCLESSHTHFKEANIELSKTNALMFKELKKFQVKLNRYHDVNYTSKVEIECAKAKGELVSNKLSYEKPCTVKFRNDQIPPILGYEDLVHGNVTIKRYTCYIRDLKGNDLIIGSHGTNLYSITLQDTNSPNPICLMAKASSSQAW